MSIAIALAIIVVFYVIIGWNRVFKTYSMWFRRDYWTNYNIVEVLAWGSKAIIIVPGLVFGIQLWQMYFLTLLTSIALIWVSMRKCLPTLIAFNSLWIIISIIVIGQNI